MEFALGLTLGKAKETNLRLNLDYKDFSYEAKKLVIWLQAF